MEKLRHLVLENEDGKVVRSLRWSGDSISVARNKRTKRLHFLKNNEVQDDRAKHFDFIGELAHHDFEEGAYVLPNQQKLRVQNSNQDSLILDKETKEDSDRYFFTIWGLTFFGAILILLGLRFVPAPTDSIREDLEQRLVKIVKRQEATPKNTSIDANVATTSTVTKNKPALKRMGALAALGSLSNSKQRGGLDLGAVKTTAGIGLGGTQGSGGVQTSLYGKGIVSAPLGTGGNLQGAGGYGTKGKGGGQAGYGTLSLVGSAGDTAFALEREAVVDAGIDRDSIAEVVRRNQGQILFCYEQGLQGTPGLNGRVAVQWTIGSQGQVKSASIANSSLASKVVEDCILMRLRSWKFPLPQGGVDVSVTYPFVLRRAGQG